MSMTTVLRLTSTIVSVLVALCFLNRPRFWWQQIVCDISLYLLPLLACLCLYSLRRLFQERRGRALAIAGALSSGYSVYLILSALMPYLWFDRWHVEVSPSAERLRLLFVDDCDIGETQSRELLDSYQPHVAVVIGGAREAFLASTERFVYRRDFDGATGVLVKSSLPLEDPNVSNLGINARPGGVLGVRLSRGKLIDMGVINLSPAFNQGDFERNRVSARRLASVMRNSDSTRLVIGNFYATPLSQFVSVFTEQARLRSVWYDHGLVKTYDMRSFFARFTLSHALISRDLAPARVERLTIPGCAHAGIFSELLVEELSSASGERSARETTMDESD